MPAVDSARAAETQLPEPLVPEDADLRSYDWFPLHHKRLRRSKFWNTASAEARAASVDLWCEAYEQVPAGSLPDDDVLLAVACGFGRGQAAEWLKLKPEVMGPWLMCSDGRWYHPTLCEIVTEALGKQSGKRKSERERKAAWREKKKLSHDVPRDTPPPNIDESIEQNLHRLVDVPPVPPVPPIEKTGQDITGEVEQTLPGLVASPEKAPVPKSRFEDGWSAFPLAGRRRSGKEASKPHWMKAAKAVGGEDELVECIRRYAAHPDTARENFHYVPAFDRWLKKGQAVNWMADQKGELHVRTGTGAATRADGRGDARTNGLRGLNSRFGGGAPEGFDDGRGDARSFGEAGVGEFIEGEFSAHPPARG